MPKHCSATIESKLCDKSSFATCDGCQQSFCLPHLTTHQQELTTQMEDIVSVHDLLREELSQPRTHTSYDLPNFAREFGLIDAWQTRTITKVTKQITQEADRARNVIRQVSEENLERANTNEIVIVEGFERLKKRLAVLSEQLQARMKSNDYLEMDIRQWNTELSDIKNSCLILPVPKHMMINKLIMGEMKQIQIDVSNVLSIEPEDPEEEQNLSRYQYDEKDLQKTVSEAYTCVAEKESDIDMSNDGGNHPIRRRLRKE